MALLGFLSLYLPHDKYSCWSTRQQTLRERVRVAGVPKRIGALKPLVMSKFKPWPPVFYVPLESAMKLQEFVIQEAILIFGTFFYRCFASVQPKDLFKLEPQHTGYIKMLQSKIEYSLIQSFCIVRSNLRTSGQSYRRDIVRLSLGYWTWVVQETYISHEFCTSACQPRLSF